MVEGHRPFYRRSESERLLPDHREYSPVARADHYYGYTDNDVFRHAECLSDIDCEHGYTCEVTDSYNHVSECLVTH